MVFDRLSVLTIRLHVTEAGAGRDQLAGRLPLLRDQLTTLQRALDGLFDDLRAGRKRFVPYHEPQAVRRRADTGSRPQPIPAPIEAVDELIAEEAGVRDAQ